MPLDDHRHCKVCGKVCAVGQETCSDRCQQRRAQAAQTRRTLTYLMYGVIALLLILLVVRL